MAMDGAIRTLFFPNVQCSMFHVPRVGGLSSWDSRGIFLFASAHGSDEPDRLDDGATPPDFLLKKSLPLSAGTIKMA